MRSLKNTTLTEHQEQSLFVEWFEFTYPNVRLFAIPNGVRTSIRQAIKAKKEGMRSGVPDIYIPSHKLWIEMKRSKGSVTSPAQKDWHHYLVDHCGDTVFIAKGFDDAMRQVVPFMLNYRV
jgi:hypothetical protein